MTPEPLLGVIREEEECPFRQKRAGSMRQNSQGSREHENCNQGAGSTNFVSKKAGKQAVSKYISKQAYCAPCSLITIFLLPAPLIILAHAPCSLLPCVCSLITRQGYNRILPYWIIWNSEFTGEFWSVLDLLHLLFNFNHTRCGSLPEILNYLPDGGQFSWVPVLIQIQL